MRTDSVAFREALKKRLYSSNLVIVGDNDCAVKFARNYSSKVSIKNFVSFDKRPISEISIDGKCYECIFWKDYKYEEKDLFILTDHPQRNGFFLESMGYIRNEHFMDWSVAKMILSEKKVIIVAGNCQIVTIHDFLSQIPEITDEYFLCRYSTHYWENRYSLESMSEFRHFCSIYINLKHEDDNTLFFSRDELPSDCRIITLASYLSPIYWPQLKVGRQAAYNELYIKNTGYDGHGTFEFGDKNINSMIVEGKSVEEIIEIITSDDYYSEDEVHDHIKRILRMMEYEEIGCDVKLADYIRDNYLHQYLFRDYTHMQVDLIWEYVRRLLRYMGISEETMNRIEVEKSSKVCESYREHCTEIPIYPSVAKSLGINWSMGRTYDVVSSRGVEKVTFEDYVRKYYDTCKLCYELKKKW